MKKENVVVRTAPLLPSPFFSLLFTHLFQGGRTSHQFIGGPHGGGSIRGPASQPSLGRDLFDQIGLEVVSLFDSRFVSHEVQRPQHQIGIVDGHSRHVAGEYIGFCVCVGTVVTLLLRVQQTQLEGVAESDCLKETGQIMISVLSFSNDS